MSDAGTAPPWLAGILQDAVEAHQAGNLEDATRLYREILDLDEDNAEARHGLGLIAHTQGRPAEGLALLREACRRDPSQARFLFNTGVVHLVLGQRLSAEAAFRAALARDPGDEGSARNLNALLLSSGREDEAVAMLRRFVGSHAGGAFGFLALAVASARAGRLEVAARTLRELVSLEPELVEARALLFHLLDQMARWEEALAEAEVLVPLDPGIGHVLRALALAGLGRDQEVPAALTQATEGSEATASRLLALGKALERVRDDFTAAQVYERALAREPNTPAARLALGTVLRRFGPLETALVHLGEAARLDPASNDAQDALVEALTAAGRLDEALLACDAWLGGPGMPDPGAAGAARLVASHRRAALAGGPATPLIPAEAIAWWNDRAAADWDRLALAFGDGGDRLIAEALEEAGAEAGLAICDLGCGTGRLGAVLRPHAAHLVGVDLSARMLDRARRRGVYDAVLQAEAAGYLDARPAAFDLVVATGLTRSFGPLEALFTAVAGASAPGGRLLLIAETTERPNEEGWRLHADGAFAHHPEYLTAALVAAGFQPIIARAVLTRYDKERPVAGHLLMGVLGAME